MPTLPRSVDADIEEAAVRSRHVAIAEDDVLVVIGLREPIATEFGVDCSTSPAIAGREAFDAAPAGFVHCWLGMVPFSGPRLQVAEICSLVQAPPPRREAARQHQRLRTRRFGRCTSLIPRDAPMRFQAAALSLLMRRPFRYGRRSDTPRVMMPPWTVEGSGAAQGPAPAKTALPFARVTPSRETVARRGPFNVTIFPI